MDWVSAKEFVEAFPMRDRQSWIEVVKRRAAEGLIRCRAAAVIVDGARLDGASPDVPARMWRNYYLRENWLSGDFETDAHPLAGNYISVKAFGVQFHREDLIAAGWSVRSEACLAAKPEEGPFREAFRPELPITAKPSDFKHQDLAHAAALIVREEWVRPGTAFKRVAPNDPMRSEDSVCRAIRAAYDLMYDNRGRPHQN